VSAETLRRCDFKILYYYYQGGAFSAVLRRVVVVGCPGEDVSRCAGVAAVDEGASGAAGADCKSLSAEYYYYYYYY
jgi:hypothetical protein